MRFLWLTTLLPYPPDSGGKMDTFYMLQEFSRMGHDISLGFFVFGDSNPEVPAELASLVKEIFFLKGNTKSLTSRLLGSLSDDVPFKFRKYYSDLAVQTVIDKVQSTGPDVILVDHLHLAPLVFDARYAARRSGLKFPPPVLRTHNVESTIVSKYAERVDNILVKTFASREASKMKVYEAAAVSEFDLVAAISPVDQTTLQTLSHGKARIISVTAGVHTDTLVPSPNPPNPGEVNYVGTFDWQPNVDAASWFVEKVWPIVIQRLPNAHLSLVGKSPPPYLEKLAGPTISLTGRVDSIEEYVSKAECCVVPLWIGSGMRYKILEAFALGKAVVSTSLGAEGIEITDGTHILLRNDPQSFASAVIEVLENPDLRDRLGTNARKLVEERYSWPDVARRFESSIESLLGKGVG
jgi:glycosyltransferase involved in cell wall biosynthesis